jgi:hypothetical protein
MSNNVYMVGVFTRRRTGIPQHPVALVPMLSEDDHDAAWATAFRELRGRGYEGGYCKRVDEEDLPAYDSDPAYRIPRINMDAAAVGG